MKLSALLALFFPVLLTSSTAFSQEVVPHFRFEPGVAAPISDPQDHRFGLGGSAMLKASLDLTPYFDVGPSVMVTELSPRTDIVPGSSVAGAWSFGFGGRLRFPNDSHWSDGTSPFLDADVQSVNTGGITRVGISMAVGMTSPLDEERHWRVGPVLRYQQIPDGSSVGGTPGADQRDARMFIFGVSLEFDPIAYQKPVPITVVHLDTPINLPKNIPTPIPPQPVKQDRTEVMAKAVGTIRFGFDSFLISDEDQGILSRMAEIIVSHLDGKGMQEEKVDQIEITGYSSSEHHPWAKKHNQLLSEKRAQAVADCFIAHGVPASLLIVKGVGEDNPIENNDTESGRNVNRRAVVDVKISYATFTFPGRNQ